MSSERSKRWVGNTGWISLYVGLLAVVLGFVFQREGTDLQDLACGFYVGGALVAAAGVGLIGLRSVMK